MRAFPILLLAVFAGATFTWPLSDTDLWWHLASGREMVDRMAWLRTDPFCTSSLGTPWIDLHWGFQLLVLAGQRLGGESGLVLLRAALVATAAFVALRGRPSWDTLAVGALLLAACRPFLDLRPLLVTLPCLAALWRILEGDLRRGPACAALALQVVLVNTQGLFLLGPAFALVAASGLALEGDRAGAVRRALLAAGLVAISLLNPWGFQAFELAFRVAARILPGADAVFAREIPENLPWLSWLRESPVRILPWFWAAVALVVLPRRGPGTTGRRLLLAFAAALSLLAVRNLPFLALATLLSVQPRRWPRPRAAAAACAALVAAFAAPALAERRWDLPDVAVAPAHFPGPASMAILRSRPGPVFHELRVGGWLSWRIPSTRTCWADTRLVLHDAGFVREYLDVLDDPSDFEAWSDRRGFRTVLVPAVAWPRWHGLLEHLLRSPRWRLVDGDGAWTLFVRTADAADSADAPPAVDRAAVDSALHARFGANPRLEGFVRAQWAAALAGTSR